MQLSVVSSGVVRGIIALWTSQLFLAIFGMCWHTALVNSQEVVGVPDEGVGGPAGTIQIISVVPGVDVPIGTKVTLTAITNTSPPFYSWDAACDGVNPWRFQQGWITNLRSVPVHWAAEITECISVPGIQTYKVTNNGLNDSKIVTFHEPDSATTSIGWVKPTGPPSVGGPLKNFQQTLTTTLKWNGVPLGPCATLCYKEKVTINSLDTKLEELLDFDTIDWYPPQCQTDCYGFAWAPTVASMRWKSPNLFDENSVRWGYDEFQYIQGLPIGTVIAKRQHQYQCLRKKLPWLELGASCQNNLARLGY